MGLTKKLTSVAAAAGLLVGLAVPAFAAYPDGVQPAAQRMKDLGIIQGRPDGNLALNDSITRAELVTIIVRAFGHKDDAALLKGAPAFPDTANHWASGEIALAKRMIEANGFSLGEPDGTFNPNGKVSTAEAIAFTMKFLGVPRDTTQQWPQDYIKGAEAAGILSTSDAATLAATMSSPADRGLVFYLADQAFDSYKLDASGKTVYTKYVKATAPTLTVDNDAASTTTDSTVTVTGSVSSDATSVYVGSTTNLATISGGKFSATVNLSMGENAIAIGATDEAGNTTVQTIKVVRTAGTAATITAPATLTVAAGQTVPLAIDVKDAKGNDVPDAVFSVTSTLGTYADGQFTAGQKAGTETVTIKDGDAVATVNLTVTAAALSTINVTPATADLAAGVAQKFTAAGTDAYGNPVDLSNVTWSASKGVIGPDGTYAATSDAAGTATITATAGTLTGTATVNVYGAASKISAAAPTNLVANDASTGNLTITVQDANGNVAKNYSGTVTLTTSDSTVASLASNSVAVVNGQATVTLTAGTTVGTAVISASATGLTGTTASVTTAAQTPSSVTLAADPATLAADNASIVDVTATLMDQTGNPMKSIPSGGAWTVDLTSSDTSVITSAANPVTLTLSALDSNGNLSATNSSAFHAGNNLGSAVISGVVKQGGVASTTVKINPVNVSTALVGVPYKLGMDAIANAATSGTTGTTQDVYVRVFDVNGNQVTAAGSAVSNNYRITDLGLAKNSGTSAVITAPASWTGGKAEFTVVDTVAESVNYTATASWGTNTLTEVTGTGKFLAGPAAEIAVSAAPSTINANGSTTTLTAKIQDANHNLVTDGSYAVTFSRATAGGAVAGWTDQTVNTVNGVATVTVTGTTAVGVTDTFTAQAVLTGSNTYVSTSDTDPTMRYAQVTTQIQGAANQVGFDTVTGATAGAATSITVDVKDGAGHTATSDNATVVTLTAKDANGKVTSYTATAQNGVATFTPSFTGAGAYTLTASAPGLTPADGLGTDPGTSTVTITPATATALTVVPSITTLGADGSSVSKVVVGAVDAYGNRVPNAVLTGTTITPSTTDAAVGTLGAVQFDVDANGNNEAYANFTAGTTPSTVTFTAALNGMTGASASITTMVVGVANRVSVTVDAPQTVYINQSPKPVQKVTVTILDANGNRVTNSGANVLLTQDSHAAIYTDSTATTAANATLGNAAVSGQATFYVTDAWAETATYTAQVMDVSGGTATADPNVTSSTATGTFNPGDVNGIALGFSPSSIVGDGSNVSVMTVKVTDASSANGGTGNLVPTATGYVKFSYSGNGGFLPNLGSDGYVTVPVVNGQASVVVQSYRVTNNTSVTVTATYFKADNTQVASQHADLTITAPAQ